MEKSKRLLVVDDQPIMAAYVRTVGEQAGYEVKTVTQAEDFMNVIDDFDPTAAVVDIVMPDIDGLELIKWLRTRGCSARIIVASADNMDYAKLGRALGRGRGLDISVVEKPFQFEELYAALTEPQEAFADGAKKAEPEHLGNGTV